MRTWFSGCETTRPARRTLAPITGVFFILIVAFGAAALGKRFRVYSIATMVIVVACGAVTGTYASQVQADLPTPAVGVWERISIATFMGWIAVLATALLRAPNAATTPDRRRRRASALKQRSDGLRGRA